MKRALHPILTSALLLLTMESASMAQGVLSATLSPDASTNVNLTTEGVTDWSHWGINGLVQDHKSVGGTPVGIISDQTLIGAAYSGAYGDNFLSYTWTDGTPTATATNSTTGIYEGGGAFQFTVPANTTSQTLKVYVGGVSATTTFTAHLSDGSAPDYTDSTLASGADVKFAPDANHFVGVYTIVFKAASAGQTLTIMHQQTGGTGNITLQAATLFNTPTVVPVAPTALSATAGTNRVGLLWNAVTGPGINNYTVYRGASATGTFTSIATTATTSYQDTTAVNGTTYYYKVTATNAAGESAFSNVASATPQAGIDGTGITGAYYNSPDTPNPKYLPSQLILTEVDPTINFNVDGTRPAGVPHDNVGVIWTGAVRAQVTGPYVFTTASDDGIRLYVDGALVIDNFIYQGTTTRNTAPITFTAGSYHTIRVTWFQGGGGGVAQLFWAYPGQGQQIVPTFALYPDATQFAPAAPTLAAVPGGQSATLIWNAPDNATSFTLYRSLTAGGPYTVIKTGLTTGTYTDTGLANSTKYYYVVQAINAKGTSPNSNEASVIPTPPVIGNGVGLAGTYYNGGAVDFSAETTTPFLYSLDPVVNFNGGGNTTGYNPLNWPNGVPATNFTTVWTGQVLAPYTGSYVFETLTDDGARLTLDSDGATGQVLFNDQTGHGVLANVGAAVNLTAGKKYNIKFEYVQGGGGYTAQLLYNPLNSGFVIIPQTQLFPNFTAAPAAPTNLVAGGGNNLVNLTWTAPNFTITYNVRRSTTAGGPYTTIATGLTTASYVDTTAVNGTTYYYVVQAVNNIGTSPNSNEAFATPVAPVIGNGIGLAGTYYNGGNTDFSAEATTPFLYNISPVINFNANNAYTTYNPTNWPSGVPALQFTTVWTGQVLAPFTGPYVFQTITDDGARLTIDTDAATGVVLFDDQTGHGPQANTGAAVNLTAGKKYNIKFEYVQGTGGYTAQLVYNPNNLGFQIIPQTQLFPNFTAAPAAPVLSATGGNNLVNLAWTGTQNAITYNVLRSNKAGGPYSTIASGLTALAYNDMNVTNGTTYYYVVQAVNNIGTTNSNEVAVKAVAAVRILAYDFENGPSGMNPDPITDITGSGNTGRSIASDVAGADAGFTLDAAAGKYSGVTKSLTNYLALPDAFDFGSQFTFYALVKLTQDNFGIQTIVATGGSGGSTGGFELYINDFNNQSHAIVFETNTGTTPGPNIQTKTRTADGVYQFDGKYHAIAAVVNRTAGSVSLYYDGVLQAVDNSTIDTTFPTATGDNRLGQFAGGGQLASNSQFDNVAVYKGLLSAVDIAALGAAGATITGKIALEGVADLAAVSPSAPLGTFHISLRQNGVEVRKADVFLATTAGSPVGTFNLPGVPAGTYDIWIKGSKNLAVLTNGVVVSATSGTLGTTANPIQLPAADANGDNSVDSSDFTALIGSFNSDATIAGSGYDPTADFNFDGFVDSSDFTLLIGQFNNVGPI